MKLQLKELKIIDLDGNIIQGDTCKAVGNLVYSNATTIEWDELSREIYKGESVDLSEAQLSQLEAILLNDQTPLILPFKKALKEYFTTLKNNANEQIKDNAKKD